MSDSGHGANPSGYEHSDANPKRLLVFTLVSVIIIVGLIIFVNEYFMVAKERQIAEVVLQPESMELREVRAHAAELLNSYAVIDSSKGVYRIPIDRAMELEAEEAFQTRKSGR